MSILEVEGLCKTYPAFRLRDVSFAVEPGAIMGFIGRNGAGKSTTIKAMLNLVHPDGGRMTMFGRDFYADEPACKQQLGVVLGGVDFYPNKKLRSITNVTRTFYDRWDENKYRHYLSLFALDETKKVSQLSSGMRVKYMLALALSHDARLLVLDEPTSGLDPVSRDELTELLRRIAADGTRSVLFSTRSGKVRLAHHDDQGRGDPAQRHVRRLSRALSRAARRRVALARGYSRARGKEKL